MPKIYSSKRHKKKDYKYATLNIIAFTCLYLMICKATIAIAQDNCVQITADYALINNKGEHIVSLWGLETLLPLDIKRAQEIINNDFCDGFDLSVTTYATDRYGQKTGLASNNNKVILQEILLEEGLAIAGVVDQKQEAHSIINRFQEIQKYPKSKKIGLWHDKNKLILDTKNTKELLDSVGTFKIVTGKITEISARKTIIYVNFDDDWKNDFTIMIPKSFTRDFEALNIAAGDSITIQGIVEKYYGPMIKLQNIQQISKAEK